jgi:hypothetical protein
MERNWMQVQFTASAGPSAVDREQPAMAVIDLRFDGDATDPILIDLCEQFLRDRFPQRRIGKLVTVQEYEREET